MTNKYKILECFTQCKSYNEEENEDGIYIDENFIAVIDGATSKNDMKWNGKTSGQIARDIIVKHLAFFNGEEEAYTVVKELQSELVQFAKRYKIGNPSASAVIYSCNRREIWSIGDCQFSINGSIEKNIKRIDQVFSEARAIALYALIEAGYSEQQLSENDIAREYILPFLKIQRYLENKSSKYGFCVFNADCLPELFPTEKIKITSVPEESEIILASDGYPNIASTLKESETNLAKLLVEDPLCYKLNYSTKGKKNENRSFDDRTYIRFKTL